MFPGGPMYYITWFLWKMANNCKPLAYFFAFAGVCYGWGLVLSLKLTQSPLHFKTALTGHRNRKYLTCALITAAIIFGGIQSISKVSEKVVPFMRNRTLYP